MFQDFSRVLVSEAFFLVVVQKIFLLLIILLSRFKRKNLTLQEILTP